MVLQLVNFHVVFLTVIANKCARFFSGLFFENMKDLGNEFGKCVKCVILDAHLASGFI